MESTCSVSSGCPVADVICRMIELGLSITGAQIGAGDVTVIEARPVQVLGFCPGCGAEGRLRDHVIRELTDISVAGHPTRLQVRVPRFLCEGAECPPKGVPGSTGGSLRCPLHSGQLAARINAL